MREEACCAGIAFALSQDRYISFERCRSGSCVGHLSPFKGGGLAVSRRSSPWRLSATRILKEVFRC